MYRFVKVKCPHCGNEFDHFVDTETMSRRQVVVCDVDETPGCDMPFVVEIEVKVEIVGTYKLVAVDGPIESIDNRTPNTHEGE